MRTAEHTLTDPDGVEVFYRSWVPDGPPRGLVLLLHGMSEHSGRYGRFAEALVGAGLAVYALDHRGHGRTGDATGTGRPGPGGFAGVLRSVRAVHERAVADVGGVPVVVFGHSMGSMIAQAYVQAHGDVVGVVLSGTPGATPELAELADGLQAMADAGAADDPVDALGAYNAPFQPARTDYDWLSRDDAEVDAYLADPRCGPGNPVTTGFLAGLLATGAAAVADDAIARIPEGLPVLFVTGDADPVSDGGATVRDLEARYAAAGLDVTSHHYAEARHELLNETNRGEVTADVLAWLGTVLD